MPIERKKVWQSKVRESENYTPNQSQGWSDNWLTWWVVAIWAVLTIFIIFAFTKFNRLNDRDSDIDTLERKIRSLEWEISTLESNQWTTVWIHYGWWSNTSNNVSWIWEKSLWFPSAAKGKNCYIIWDKIRWEWWWSLWWRIWISGNWWRYTYSTSYEAEINNRDQKIEITKNWYNSDSNLTNTERNNLYLSFTMLCR